MDLCGGIKWYWEVVLAHLGISGFIFIFNSLKHFVNYYTLPHQRFPWEITSDEFNISHKACIVDHGERRGIVGVDY